MKELLAGLAVATLFAATAQPAFAQDAAAQSGPQATQQGTDGTQQNDQQNTDGTAPADGSQTQQPAGPKLAKRVPKAAAPDTALVVGGLAGIAAIGLAAGSGGGSNGEDKPSSP